MSSQHFLIVALPDQEPVSYLVSGEKVTLGRAPDNDIQILVREVSTRHCEFSRAGDGYQLIDVGSSNGTRVKGQSITNGRVFLNDREMILLGETVPTYFVVVEDAASFDPREIIQSITDEIKAGEAAAKEETEKPKLPAFKPASPSAAPTAVAESQAGAATVVLKKVPSLKSVPPKAVPPNAAVPPAKKKGAPQAKQETPAKKAPPRVKLKLPGQEGLPPKTASLPAKKRPKLNLPKNPGKS